MTLRALLRTHAKLNLKSSDPFVIARLNYLLIRYHAIASNDVNANSLRDTDASSSCADDVFAKIPQRDALSHNHLLFDLSRSNRNQEALKLFISLRRSCLPVDESTFSCVLKVCASLFDYVFGKQLHCECVKFGFVEDVSVGTSLVSMYMRTGNVDDAMRVFYEMNKRNVALWTSLLSGFAKNGMNDKALNLFFKMQIYGIEPNPLTFATVFGVLASEGMLEIGKQVHAVVLKKGFQYTTFVCNSLINMYSKSGMIKNATTVFDKTVEKDAVSWNSMIAGYVTNGLDIKALQLFYQMRVAGIKLTESVFVTVTKICANLGELSFSRQIHCHALKGGFGCTHNMETALMVAYSKCNEMNDAFRLFSTMHGIRNVVSWTAMITGYLLNGEARQATSLFCQMVREGVQPNHFTYSIILKGHPFISPFQIHAQVIKTNYDKLPSVGSALLDSYVRLGNLPEAAKVFELIEEEDIVAWSAMLAAYAQAGNIDEAIRIFLHLAKERVKPNEYTFSSVIHACAAPTASVEQGKQFHASSIKAGHSNALCVSSALVTMYAKRGNIEAANEVFKRQEERDLVSWNSMLSGYAQHGQAKKALKIFEELQRQNIKMDGVTFIGVLTACTHSGLVEEGENYFNMMLKYYHIDPTMQHYSCMVDLFGRAGKLEKAADFVREMPFPAGPTVWRTLLSACRVHRNVEIGKLAAENLISLEPHDSAAYVLLSNLYAVTGNWRERAKVRKLMDDRNVRKEAGYSWIEVKNKTHSFLAGDLSHPLSGQIYSKLDELNIKLKDAGYQPDTNYVLHDVEEEHKEAILSQHSERLAIAFGLIVTPSGTPIQIVKNLRVCGDCHTVIKLISLIEARNIVVRDSNRFHHFKKGLCSCGDYW